jgi:hypothetical protein
VKVGQFVNVAADRGAFICRVTAVSESEICAKASPVSAELRFSRWSATGVDSSDNDPCRLDSIAQLPPELLVLAERGENVHLLNIFERSGLYNHNQEGWLAIKAFYKANPLSADSTEPGQDLAGRGDRTAFD